MRRMRNLTGQRNGRLTVIEDRGKDGTLVCKCDCGAIKYLDRYSLRLTQSCGCLRREKSSETGKRVVAKNFAKRRMLCDLYGTNVGLISRGTLNKNNRTGHTGVYFEGKRGKYLAYIYFRNKKYHLGAFSNIDDAIKARSEAEDRLFGPVIEHIRTNELK